MSLSLAVHQRAPHPSLPKAVLPHNSYRVSRMPGLDTVLLGNGEHRDGRFTVFDVRCNCLSIGLSPLLGKLSNA